MSPQQSNLHSLVLKGRQVMGVRRKQTPRLGGCILKSFLLATVQNHGGEGSGPVPTSPSPLGSGAKYKKRITNTEWDGGDSISHGRQGQALLTISHLHPEFSKIQTVKVYDPSGLLTKNKISCPQRTHKSEGSWPIRDGQKGDRWKWSETRERDRQRRPGTTRGAETGRQGQRERDRLPPNSQKQRFQFRGMALGANVTKAEVAEALTHSRARTHTPIYNIFIYT